MSFVSLIGRRQNDLGRGESSRGSIPRQRSSGIIRRTLGHGLITRASSWPNIWQ